MGLEGSPPLDLDALNVLLVDDDEDAFVMTRYMLSDVKNRHFHLDWEASYDAGLAAINRHQHDVCLVDYRLDSRDGLELLREALKGGCKAPIIMLTGQGDHELDSRALQSGAADYLSKDEINGPQLERTIRHAIERKKAEQALADEKELLAVTLRSIGDGVIVTDWQGRIILLNRTAEDLTGHMQAQAKGKPLRSVLRLTNPTSKKPYRDPVETTLSSLGTVEFDPYPSIPGANGKEVTIELSGSKIHDSRHNTYAILFVFRDISSKLRMEKEILRTSKLESLGNLAGGIAHDFNNLLCAISGSIQLASLSLSSDHEVQTTLHRAENSCRRAQALTQEFLTFSKGGKPLTKPTSIPDLFRRTTQLALSGLPIKCQFSLPEDLWIVQADEAQVGQAISNILTNAAEAMPEGGTVTISVENETFNGQADIPLLSGSYVKINIADKGKGIAKSNIDKIFDPYFSTKPKGTGLGLTAAFYIIKNHGGVLMVDSRPGRGSVFRIYLPASSATSFTKEQPLPKSSRRSGRILIMDDEALVRETVTDVLSHRGYEVYAVVDGSEAVRTYEEHQANDRPFDAVIVDLTVPGGMGGLETLKKLKELDPHSKVLVSSGYSNNPIMSSYRKYGFCAVVAKPFRVEMLDTTLQTILSETT